MTKLIATFFYQGSADKPIYRRVELCSIAETPTKLFGYESTRDDVVKAEFLPFKSYSLSKIGGLCIVQVSEPTASQRLSKQLRAIADELEGSSN